MWMRLETHPPVHEDLAEQVLKGSIVLGHATGDLALHAGQDAEGRGETGVQGGWHSWQDVGCMQSQL